MKCCDPVHICGIDRLYNDIIAAIEEASKDLVQTRSVSQFQVPGWAIMCKDAHLAARKTFLFWRQRGSPKYGEEFHEMQRSRAHFKLSLRQCRLDKHKQIADSLANKFLNKNTKDFWKDINGQCSGYGCGAASSVGGVTGTVNVCNMWHDHFKQMLNSSSDFSCKDKVLEEINSCSLGECCFSPLDVKTAVHKLKKGKSAGLDGISAEHYIFSHDRLNVLLCLFINSCVNHGYLPVNVLDTVISPIIKDKKGAVTDKDNYRPIAVTCISSKIVEILVLGKFCEYLSSSDHQFGFKQNQSTDMCIFALKEIIDYYNSKSSPVYMCFMDASKAFDKVNHWFLFKKLLLRGLPGAIVRLLIYWYSSQNFLVLWTGVFSSAFTVTNGVRQGGIMSPILYNVFIDDLSFLLSGSKVGCHIKDTCVNHLFYADDSVLLAPSPYALQKLVDICQSYASQNEITYNVKKTVCMNVMSENCKNINVPNVFLGECPLLWVKSQKYLGVFLSCDMNDRKDMRRQLRAIYGKGNQLLRKFRKCTLDVKKRLFKAYCSNLYCCQLWCNYSTSCYKEVKVAYNNIFRNFLNINRRSHVSELFVLAGIDTFDVLIRKSVGGFKIRAENSKNHIVSCVISSNFFILHSKLGNCWRRILYKLQTVL